MTQSLTNSMLGGACKVCLRKAYLQYKLMISPKARAVPLRLGSGTHAIVEHFYAGEDNPAVLRNVAVQAYREGYESSIPFMDEGTRERTEKEEHILGGIAAAYPDVYRGDREQWEILHNELPVVMDIMHPVTKEIHPFWKYSVTLDLVIRDRETGVVHLVEHKTSGKLDQPYWTKLRMDPQLSGYMLALLALGYSIGPAIYNVIRKPGIRLRKDETPEAFYERLRAEFVNDQEKYFHRVEIDRDNQQYQAFMLNLWGWANFMQDMWEQPEDKWLKSDINQCVQWGRMCEMFDICADGLDSPNMVRFIQRSEFHPEHEDRSTE